MKTLIALTTLLITLSANAQYFGRNICFLEKHINHTSNTFSGIVAHLTYLDSTNVGDLYSFKSDTIIERNDSIFLKTITPAQDKHTSLLFSMAIKELDSFFLQHIYHNGEVEDIIFYVDSVVFNGVCEITYFHNKPTQFGYSENFAWRDSLGDVKFGPNYTDVFNQIDYSIEFLAYSKNNEFYYMDGQSWQTLGDTSCKFEESLRTLTVRDIKVQQLVVHPNPSSSYLYIKDSVLKAYKVYNSYGILVMQGVEAGRLDISNLKTGVYYVELFDHNNVLRGKFTRE